MSADFQREKAYKILVFGSQSAGKTSVINLLVNGKNKIGNSLMGTTFEFVDTEYTSPENNKTYEFTDTIGINDAFKLQHTRLDYLKNYLIKFKLGFNLLIHVKRKGAIIKTDKQNYDFVVKNLFGQSAKTLCVITEAENIELPDEYWRMNRNHFAKNGMIYSDGIAVCSGVSENPLFDSIYQPLRQESREKLWNMINKNLSCELFYPKIEKSSLRDFFESFSPSTLLTSSKNFLYDILNVFNIFIDMPLTSQTAIEMNIDKDQASSIDRKHDLYLFALLCDASKKYSKINDEILLQKGWRFYDESKSEMASKNKNGYQGIAYIRKDNILLLIN